ncbi:MAG: PilZ domain-containing protein [Bdellovibrionaceae bacterium]|jgi:hypothetical protein|nr:PilZ domain-containing protein [Pseudobdellovibrionaceae bacterium]
MSNDVPSTREPRVKIDAPCTLNPWEIKANILDMSMSGAFLECTDFPDDLLTSFDGEVVVQGLVIPGKFIRLDKLKIGLEFTAVNPQLKKQLEDFLQSYSN